MKQMKRKRDDDKGDDRERCSPDPIDRVHDLPLRNEVTAALKSRST